MCKYLIYFKICNIDDRHGLKLYFVVLGDIMIGRSKIRTPEQRSKKMLNEERTIMNLKLAVKKKSSKRIQKQNLDSMKNISKSISKIDRHTIAGCLP